VSNKPKSLFITFERGWAGYSGLAFSIACLNIITFGLYKPYGITHMRRALYNSITVGSQPLAYTGDAKSLSRVSFYPSLAFLFLLLVPGVLQFMVPLTTAVWIGVVQILLVMLFYQYREFLERQYHLSQISWRGESFTLNGSAFKSMLTSFGFQLAGLCTFGFTALWRRIWLARRDYDGLYFGRTRMSCTISPWPLLPAYLIGWVFALVGLYFIWKWVEVDARLVWNDMLKPMVSGAGEMAAAVGGGQQADFYGGALGGGMPGMDMMSDPEAASAVLTAKLNALISVGLAWPLWVSWRMVCLSVYEAKWWQELADSIVLGPYRLRIESEPVLLTLLNVLVFNINFMMANLTRPFTTYFRIRYFCNRSVVRESMP